MTEPPAPPARLNHLRDVIGDLVPVVRRAASLDAHSLARLRLDGSTATIFVRLPFAVLVSRRVPADTSGTIDVTLDCTELLTWYDGDRADEPRARDVQWRSALPPAQGWHQIDTVPDSVVRDLVRKGALAVADAGRSADALLDSVVLHASSADHLTAEVTLRALSALTRMGFLPRGSHIVISVAGRWTRVAAEYGSVYLERPGLGIGPIAPSRVPPTS